MPQIVVGTAAGCNKKNRNESYCYPSEIEWKFHRRKGMVWGVVGT